MLGLAHRRRLRLGDQGAARAHDGSASRCSRKSSRKDDNHFGAHHYLIHGWEGSKTPEKAWHASERYPELVPNIPHALHMPGHIYAQSDKIDEAITAFTAAAENELKWIDGRRAVPERPSRPQRPLPDSRAESRRPLPGLDEVGAAPASRSRRRRASSAGNSQRGAVAPGLLRADQDAGAVREVERRSSTARRSRSTTSRSSRRGGSGRSGWRRRPPARSDRREGDARRSAEGRGSDRRRRSEPLAHRGAWSSRRRSRARSGDRKKALRAVPQGRGSRSGADLHRAAVLSASGRRRAGRNVALALGDFATAERAYREALDARAGQRPRVLRPGRRSARPGQDRRGRGR